MLKDRIISFKLLRQENMTWGIKWMIIFSLRKMIELNFAIVVTVEEEEDMDLDQMDTQDLMPMKMKWVRPFVMYRRRNLP